MLTNEQIDKALGFDGGTVLTDKSFPPLEPKVVSKLAPRLASSKESASLDVHSCDSISYLILREVFGKDAVLLPDGRSFRTKTMDELFQVPATHDLWGLYRFGLTKQNDGIQLVFHPGTRRGADEQEDKSKCRAGILSRLPKTTRNNLLCFPKCKDRLELGKGNTFGEWMTAIEWSFPKCNKSSESQFVENLKCVLTEIKQWEQGIKTGDGGRVIVSPIKFEKVFHKSDKHGHPKRENATKSEMQIPRVISECLPSHPSFRRGPCPNNIATSELDSVLPPFKNGTGGWLNHPEIYRLWIRESDKNDGVRLTLELGPGPIPGNKPANLALIPEAAKAFMERVPGFNEWAPKGRLKIYRYDLFSEQCKSEYGSIHAAISRLLEKLQQWQQQGCPFFANRG